MASEQVAYGGPGSRLAEEIEDNPYAGREHVGRLQRFGDVDSKDCKFQR